MNYNSYCDRINISLQIFDILEASSLQNILSLNINTECTIFS